jgi:hypothetical protein
MTKKAEQSFYRHRLVNDPTQDFDLLSLSLDLSDDPYLATAYIISEIVVTVIGPLFWACLIYLFLLAELGVGSRAV